MKIIKHNYKKGIFKIFLRVSIIVLAIPLYFYTSANPGIESSFLYQIFCGIFGFIFFCIMMYSIFIYEAYDITGELLLKRDSIEINNERIDIEEIVQFYFDYQSMYGIGSPGGYFKSFGNDNIIRIRLRNNKVIEFYLLLERKTELKILKQALNYYQNIGINVIIKE